MRLSGADEARILKKGSNVLKTGFEWPSTQRLPFEVSY